MVTSLFALTWTKSLVIIGGQSGCHHFSPITATAYFLDFWHPQWLFFESPPTLSPAVTVIFWKHKFDHVSLLLKILGFHGGSVVKNLPGNVGDTDSNPGLEKSPGAGNGNPLPYSCWEIPCTEEPGGVQFVGLQTVRYDQVPEQQQQQQQWGEWHKRVRLSGNLIIGNFAVELFRPPSHLFKCTPTPTHHVAHVVKLGTW